MPSRLATLAESDALKALVGLCRDALMAQEADDARRFCGRWALPSGSTFRVARVVGIKVLIGDGKARWWIDVADMRRLVNAGRLRFVGR